MQKQKGLGATHSSRPCRHFDYMRFDCMHFNQHVSHINGLTYGQYQHQCHRECGGCCRWCSRLARCCVFVRLTTLITHRCRPGWQMMGNGMCSRLPLSISTVLVGRCSRYAMCCKAPTVVDCFSNPFQMAFDLHHACLSSWCKRVWSDSCQNQEERPHTLNWVLPRCIKLYICTAHPLCTQMMSIAHHPALERLGALLSLNGFYQSLNDVGPDARRSVLATPSVLTQQRVERP